MGKKKKEMKKSTQNGENSVYFPPFISAPAKYDPLGDDFEEWLTSAELYMKIVGRAQPDDPNAAILLSLFDQPTLSKLRARAKETGKDLQDLSFDEVRRLLRHCLSTTKPIFAE